MDKKIIDIKYNFYDFWKYLPILVFIFSPKIDIISIPNFWQGIRLDDIVILLYLIYLAYDTYTSRIRIVESGNKNLRSIFSFYRDGFLVAGLSPKSIIFFGTIFTSFIDFSSNYFAQFLILIITYVILDFTTLMIYAFAANKVSIWLKDNPKVLNTISACVLIIIAVYVAASQNY